ncbi:MAG: DUF885 domain-containing protein [Bifidobacteriaceae bacterium]|jgi:uncharacterized protein (DUF885 family)|nr:DUF885 domain-containing protein [Bifidobacteriaceae bacterium]
MSTSLTPAATSGTARQPSAIDRIADQYVERMAALDPIGATVSGINGHDTEMTDYSPAGEAARDELNGQTLAALAQAAPADETDRVTVAAMNERLGLERELYAAGEPFRKLNNIECPLQYSRDVFDQMPTATVQDWEQIAERLGHVPEAIDSYRASLRLGQERGLMPAARQAAIGAAQAQELARPGSFFDAFAAGAPASVAAATPGTAFPDSLSARLSGAAAQARAAYGRLADFLSRDLLPHAPTSDAVGRERYELASREFLGARIDLDETYEWGLAELAHVDREERAVAAQIAGPGATKAQAVEILNRDPAYQLHGTDALQRWMQETADQAIDFLDGTHFDFTDQMRRLDCRIAPTQNGGIYYTGPNEDFTRPGTMWWSVPPGVTEFNTWFERTTVYHEGVPGHHMQMATAIQDPDLNRWRKVGVWVSGHGEGWALYAERLMDDLGFLATPGDRLGMLDSQKLRCARVVFDIGVHLAKPCPEAWGGGTWDADKGWNLLRRTVAMEDSFLKFEFERYLGWPGQAPSYRIGQRIWEELRDEAKARAASAGRPFSLKDFHTRALRLGSVGLDVLRAALRGTL